MRLGITEWLSEPLDLTELDAALRRVTKPATATAANGQAFAVVGGKGGVGCTTIAVNLAAAIHRATKEPTLLVDLHMAQGDTSVYLGVEPRFTVLDALENIHRLDEIYFKGLVTATPAGIDLLAAANRPSLGSIDVLRVRALVEFVSTALQVGGHRLPTIGPGRDRRARRDERRGGRGQSGAGHVAERQPPGRHSAPALRRPTG